MNLLHSIDDKLLLGPGPSTVSPAVYTALHKPVIGHLDPAYLEVLDEIRSHLQMLFQTKNALTHAVPGTGTSGMEACVGNLIEPGDKVLVAIKGYFGERLVDMASRYRADINIINKPY